jgi:glutamine transport system substrate-binding protein
MKKYYLAVLALLGVMNLSNAKTLKVGTNATYPPFESFNKKGDLVGFDIDLLNALAKELNYELEYVDLPFMGLVSELQTKKVDLVISCWSKTKERAEKVDFSDGYFDIGVNILVQSTNDKIKSKKDLATAKIGVEEGSAQVKYVEENFPKAKIFFYDNVNIYTALLLGKVDAILMDDLPAANYLKTKDNGKLKIVGEVLNPKQAGIGFPKGSAMVKEFNKALKKLKKSGEFEKIRARWFD